MTSSPEFPSRVLLFASPVRVSFRVVPNKFSIPLIVVVPNPPVIEPFDIAAVTALFNASKLNQSPPPAPAVCVPPSIVSEPNVAIIVSSPAPAHMVFVLLSPLIVSALLEPIIFSILVTWSCPANPSSITS